MIRYSTIARAIALTFSLVLFASCSDDDSPAGGGSTDTTAPSVTSVTALDGNHIEVLFDENVQRASAETPGNYVIVEAAPIVAASGGVAPGDTLLIFGAALQSDQRTVTLTTDTMGDVGYDMSVANVRDASGNAIGTPVARSFTGSSDPDVTAPELVYRSPGPNATNVPVGTQILLTFSESVTFASFVGGFTISDGGGSLPYLPDSADNGIHIVVQLQSLLDLGTQYTITMTGIQDANANTMPDVTWSFTTTNTADTTPPTVVSSSPANGAVNVDVNTSLSITFSEPVNQVEFGMSSYPGLNDGTIVWSNGGKTLTFTPFVPLAANQQYTIAAVPGAIKDLSGNGNTSVVQIRFSTGAALATGSFAGSIAGDPNSDFAQDPSGARIFAVTELFEDFDALEIAGSTTVAGNDSYDLLNLADGDFYAISIMNTNNDGRLNPLYGDAIGAFGVDFSVFDTEADSVSIAGGNRVTDVDFPLFDPSAIAGTISYNGAYADGEHMIGVGLFVAATFDPMNSPDYGIEAFWPFSPEWLFLNLEHGFADDTYYVGAFLDGNDNLVYDPGTDPIGIFGGMATPTAIDVLDGSDQTDIVITLFDPPALVAGTSVQWPTHPKRQLPSWVRAFASAIATDQPTRQW